jgi:hypothetical protein
MRRIVRAWLAIATITCIGTTNALAQVICSECVLGLYGDIGRTWNVGVAHPNFIHSIYLGLDLAAPETGWITLEFSIHGMRPAEDGIIITNVAWLTSTQPNIIIGTINAPADTSASSAGTGGINVAWPTCVVGSQTVARIDYLFFAPLVNKVFTVKRRYPPTNPAYLPRPLLYRCDDPNFTPAHLSTGCFILNWNGDPAVLACLDGPVEVEPRNWSGMKALYR